MLNQRNTGKVAFVGPAAIHKALSAIDEDWDFQEPIETIQDFSNDLSSENRKISTDTSVVIVFSRLYNADPEGFGDLVAYLAPYSVVCILHPQQDISDKANIQSKVADYKAKFSKAEPGYNAKAPYYFVPYDSPQSGIIDSLVAYIADPYASNETKDLLRIMVPKSAYSDFEPIEDTVEEEVYEDTDSKQGQVIAVTSSKGGSGKSTVSLLLGAYIAKGSQILAAQTGTEPLKVCLLDLDSRDGQLHLLCGAFMSAKNVFNIFTDYAGGAMDEALVNKGIWNSPQMGCDFVFAVKRPRIAKGISPSFYVSLIKKLRTMYDYVIIDTSVNYLDPLLENVAYPMADKIVFVTDMGVSSILGMARWIAEVTGPKDTGGSEINAGKIGIVVNKVLRDVNMDPEKIEKTAGGLKIISCFPSVPKMITYAANTAQMQLVLNHRDLNRSTAMLAEAITKANGHRLGEVPYNNA